MRFKRIMSGVLSASMVIAFAPQAAFAQQGLGADTIAQQESAALDDTLAAANYEEGQAIVVVDTSLSDAAAGAVHSALEGADLLAGAQDVMDVSASAFKDATGQYQATDVQVKCVTSSTLSTKELIAKLLEDPRVISAEPNVTGSTAALDGNDAAADSSSTAAVADNAAASDAAASSSAESVTPKAEDDAVNITGIDSMPDLTSYQWYTGADSSAGAGTSNGTMLMPGSSNASSLAVPNWNTNANANGAVVAVMDSGVNYDHPDIQPNMMDMTSYNQGSAYENVAGKYGYNPAGWDQESTSDPMDDEGHGTHVAGIMCANWDGKGTSGIAGGAKLVAIKITEAGSFSYLACLKGYRYLSAMMDKGLNLTSVNCSWAGVTASPSLVLAMTQLGQKGAVTCVASGNEHKNLSKSSYSSAHFSNSPYAVIVNSSNIRGEQSDFSNYGQGVTDIYAPGSSILSTYTTNYLPYADPSPSYYQDFASESAASSVVVRKTTQDAAPFGTGEVVGQYSADASFDKGTGSLLVPLDKTAADEYTQCFELQIPVTKDALAQAAYLGLTACGNSKMLSISYQVAVSTKKGATSYADTAANSYNNTWCDAYVSLSSAVEAVDKATGVAIKDGYMSVKVSVSADEAQALSDGDGAVYLDTIGLGSSVCDYKITHGTSMATPCTTSSAAVIATQLAAKGASGEQLAQQVARAIKGSVVQSDAMRATCTAGGIFSFTMLDAVTPVIEQASQEGDVITLNGAGFGSKQGTVTVGGEDASVTAWSDTQIALQVPAGIKSGERTVLVISANGQTGAVVASVTQGKPALYEKSISLPTANGGPGQSAFTCMAALGGKIYVLCSSHFGNGDKFKQLWSYDVKSGQWAKLASLPYSKAAKASMAVYKGKVLVACGGVLSRGVMTKKNALYSYDPSSNAWTKLAMGKKLPYATTLVRFSGKLMAVGGQETDEYGALSDVKKVSHINLRKQTVTRIGKLTSALSTAQATANSGVLYVSNGLVQDATSEYVEKPVVNAFKMVKGKLVRYNLRGALPKAAKGYMDSYGAAATPQGLVISGYPAYADKNSKLANDTFVLSLTKKGAAKCKALGSSFSYSTALQVTSVYCKGWYYSLGCAYNEGAPSIMRATKL